jgi:hypothetical protein
MKQAYTQLQIPKGYTLGEAVHIYIPEKEFCNWLVECAKKETTLKYGRLVQKSIGGKPGVLHFPTSAKLPSICFECLHPLDSNGKDPMPEDVEKEINKHFGHDCALLFSYSAEHQNGSENERLYFENLLNGLGMYLDCFPEMMREGVPEELKHPAHHQHKIRKTLCISSKIMEKRNGNNITPHFRCGHFRVLISPVFTHKRFQTIFVHETFVKGKAVTVDSPETAKAK